ncbi:MAG: hypothetical protein AzoDbin1_05394 [Azoarcus sp.]|nr:hypothetical protein [Azoarcus sp.]
MQYAQEPTDQERLAEMGYVDFGLRNSRYVVIDGGDTTSWVVSREVDSAYRPIVRVNEYDLTPDDDTDPDDARLAPDGMYRGDLVAMVEVPVAKLPEFIAALVDTAVLS